jgi:hypothetical protein
LNQKTKDLSATLDAAGIPNQPYARDTVGGGFIVAIDERNNNLRFYVGEGANVTVVSDRKLGQAVLQVTEKARQVTRSVSVKRPTSTSNILSVDEDEHRCQNYLLNNFPIVFPQGRVRRWTYANLRITTAQPNGLIGNDTATGRLFHPQQTVHGDVTAHVRASSQTLLVGFDEGEHLFVSLLKQHAKDVADAHRILRPKGVTDAAVRQGEWFFQPVTQRVLKELDQHIYNQPGALQYETRLGGWAGSHQATTLRHKRKTYAIGWVLDIHYPNRGMRTRHHMPLLLQDWHEVIRNNEVVAPDLARGRSWD